MKYLVTIRGDINDADYAEESNIVDLDGKVFSGWNEELDALTITFGDLLTAFGQAFKWFATAYPHRANWREEERSKGVESAQSIILHKVIELLNVVGIVTPSDLSEATWDFFPGSCDYPVHTIYKITATPATDQIVYY